MNSQKNKSKHEHIREFEGWYKNEESKPYQEQESFIITPSDEDSIDNV